MGHQTAISQPSQPTSWPNSIPQPHLAAALSRHPAVAREGRGSRRQRERGEWAGEVTARTPEREGGRGRARPSPTRATLPRPTPTSATPPQPAPTHGTPRLPRTTPQGVLIASPYTSPRRRGDGLMAKADALGSQARRRGRLMARARLSI